MEKKLDSKVLDFVFFEGSAFNFKVYRATPNFDFVRLVGTFVY